jgi:glycosyltransferase involved in cell wall biosynthesis/SAM-dependent methyltransferase
MASVARAYELDPPPGWQPLFLSSWQPDAALWGAQYALSVAARIVRLPARTVVHAHLSYRGSFVREGLLLALAKARGLPTCVTIHGSRFREFAGAAPRLAAATLRCADAVFCLTPADCDVARHLLPTARVIQLPNTVRVPPASPPPSSVPPVALFAGELSKRKGLDVLLASWRLVADAVPGAQLWVAGPAGDVPIEADRDTTSSVRYLGVLAPTGVQAALAQARAAVLPSRAEAMPIFSLEAMAAGRPLVVSAVGSMADLPKRAAIVVEPGEPHALADGLARFLGDGAAADAAGAAGREWVSLRHEPRAVHGRLAIAYEDLVAHAVGSHIAPIPANGQVGDNAGDVVCNTCGSPDRHTVFAAGVAQKHAIVTCSQCGLMYAHPKETANLSRYADGNSEAGRITIDSPEVRRARDKLPDYAPIGEYLRKLLPSGSDLVEVGCYAGVLLQALKLQGWSARGVEPDPIAAEFARTEFDLQVIPSTLEDAGLEAESADAVVMLHVIERLDDPAGTLGLTHRILRPGGFLVVETPIYDSWAYRLLGRRERSISCDGHIFFYTRPTLRDLLARVGFEVVVERRVGRTVSLGRLLWNLGVMARSATLQRLIAGLNARLQLTRHGHIHLNTGDMVRLYARKV